MKTILTITILFIAFLASAQEVQLPVKISDFSEQYEALIDWNEKDSVNGFEGEKYLPQYVIRIFEKQSRREILKSFSDYFPDYLMNENNEAIANIKELPYGSQSVLIYEDFNFDGAEDLALMNGNNSCYSGPSFDIYLAKKAAFEYSEAFSRLASEYCGMFQVHPETKTISTMTKSGCCWHQYSTFKIVNNNPVPVKIVEEAYVSNYSPDMVEVTETSYPGGKERVKTRLFLPYDFNESKAALVFTLSQSRKKVLLFEEEGVLFYVLLKPAESVEFSFPQAIYDETTGSASFDTFTFRSSPKSLVFSNKQARYELYETDTTIGIRVTANSKSYDLKGDKVSQKGSLKAITGLKVTNVNIENK